MVWNSENVSRNIRKFYSQTFLRNGDFSRGLFVIYLLSIGKNNFQIGVLQTILFLSTVLFEIPSGLFADRFKRKYSLAAGSLFLATGFLIFPITENIYALSFVFFLIGVGFAFSSGAEDALLYDGLKEAGEPFFSKHFNVMSKNRSFSMISITIAMIIGGFLYDIEKSLIFYVTSICMILSGFMTLLISESSRVKTKSSNDSLVTQLKSFVSSKNGRQLLLLILGLSFIEAMHTPFFIFSQSLFASFDLSGKSLGILYCVGYLVSSISMMFFSKLPSKDVKRPIVWTIALVILLCPLIYIFRLNLIGSICLFLLINTIPNIMFLYTDQYIQDNCPSEIRASLISTQSFINSLVIAISYLSIGYFADLFSIATTLSFLTILPIISLVTILFYFRKVGQN